MNKVDTLGSKKEKKKNEEINLILILNIIF